jgi:hypothetical protein
MPLVGLEPTIPGFEQAKTVHALDRAATVLGRILSSDVYTPHLILYFSPVSCPLFGAH